MIHKFEIDGIRIVLDVNSGAVHIVDKLVYEILDYYPSKGMDETFEIVKDKYSKDEIDNAFEEIRYLKENDMLFCDDSYINDSSFINRKPVIKALCLHIAHDCNIRCEYCFASQGDFKGDRSLMSEEVGKKALDLLIENSGNRRNLEVDFFGGEPLLNFDVVKKLVEYGRKREKETNKNFRFTLTTNGVLLNDEIIEYINENMENVVLSIDGRKEINDKMRYTINRSGTYDIILPKIKKMVEARKDKSYYVRGTFTKHNLDFANDVLHLADLGFKNTSVEPVVAEPGMPYELTEKDLPVIYEHYENLAKEMIRREKAGEGFNFFHFTIDLNQGPCVIKRLTGCGAGSEYLAITPQGDLYPCHQFVGNEDFKIGDVDSGIINRELGKKFGNAHVYNKQKCRDCWAKFYCSGGCHANAFNFNKDINIPYELGCEMEKKRIECSLYVKAKLSIESSK
ncbi:thioether cross-link-forming SCIFF peptide maturase [Wukongibacter sp. M2B1]|uniref:thioether cross-link-forming SCIFF peptide maturase n=1 Tax=Wukongibacter sp. M2B1 TaxID=3088895 RepID=UPI003D791638